MAASSALARLNQTADVATQPRQSLLKSRAPAYKDGSRPRFFRVVEHTLYENQRWGAVYGWSSSSLLLLDRPAWSTADGKRQHKSQAVLPKGWTWSDDEWKVDNLRLDGDGWCYGLCFGAAVGRQWVRFVKFSRNFFWCPTSHFLNTAGNPAQWTSQGGEGGIADVMHHLRQLHSTRVTPWA